MNIHDPEGLQCPDFVPTIEVEGGTIFLTCKQNHRQSIASMIERLIGMLDEMDGDPDIEVTEDEEPYLGWPNAGQPVSLEMCDDREQDNADWEPWLGAAERHPMSVETIACGVLQPRSGALHHVCCKSQEDWAAGGGDDREDEDEREDGNDDEFSSGWANEGSQATLRSDDEREPELGWTDHIDQTKAGEQDADCWMTPDGEPLLGWCENAGKGIAEGEPANECDGLAFNGDGQRKASELLCAVKPRRKPNLTYGEIAHKLPDGTIMRTFVASTDSRALSRA
jgi:hypothetical protein